MSHVHWREKIRNVMNHANKSEHVPEKAKNTGLGCFFIALLLAVLLLSFLGVGSVLSKQYIGAVLLFAFAFLLGFIAIKLWTAD